MEKNGTPISKLSHALSLQFVPFQANLPPVQSDPIINKTGPW